MRAPWTLAIGIILACWLAGCHITWVRSVRMDAHLTNDHNQLLTVEGKSNLPDGALLEARLLDRDGRRWSSGRGEVKNGRYSLVMDVSRSPGFRALTLELFFDPLVASAAVQRLTGPRGEALQGPLVMESHDRALVMLRQRVVLTMSARQSALRRLESGDGDIDELRSYLIRHPNDAHSLIGLGLAFLKQRPSQRHKGSEAYKMLQEGIRYKPAETSLEMEARLWVARLDEKERREREERERSKPPVYAARFRDENLIRPGQALGAFELRMPFQFLSMSFRLKPTSEPNIYTIDEFPDLRLGMASQYGPLVSIWTNSPRFHTQEGLAVGSSLDDLTRLIPDLEVNYGPEETRADGRVYSNATIPLEGLRLLVERSYDPMLPLPEASIRWIEVVPPSTASP